MEVKGLTGEQLVFVLDDATGSEPVSRGTPPR